MVGTGSGTEADDVPTGRCCSWCRPRPPGVTQRKRIGIAHTKGGGSAARRRSGSGSFTSLRAQPIPGSMTGHASPRPLAQPRRAAGG